METNLTEKEWQGLSEAVGKYEEEKSVAYRRRTVRLAWDLADAVASQIHIQKEEERQEERRSA